MGEGDERGRRRGCRNGFVFPTFCRLSIKDVRFRHTGDRSDDPSSPKVSCIGQVRRKNRGIGFNTTAAANSSAAASRTDNIQHPHNYTKLITKFSGRTLVPPITTNNSGSRRSGSRSCRTTREMISVSDLRMTHLKRYDRDGFADPECVQAVIDVAEMDPPLPVMKRVTPPGGGGVGEVNIWKRRFNGVALKSLQIDQIHLSKSRFLPPTTV
ncbi:hypothetical protein F511_10495 [Dorcoceras hygrometricum]|uniref:Uncharacterized protein n=1 Tax=Dorcoceras hygrometricum TaxID=472368 RepID=A0A2Z7D1N9_9LAMI|nr:hypothetical protein F511_10495 [Dorcoceras hygrometricum]